MTQRRSYHRSRSRRRQKSRRPSPLPLILMGALVLLAAALLIVLFVSRKKQPADTPPASPTPVSTPVPTPAAIPTTVPEALPSPTPAPTPAADPGEAAPALQADGADGTKRPLYEIAARLDTELDRVQSTMKLTYTNNTPDPLYNLCLRLYPNRGGSGYLTVHSAAVDGQLISHTLSGDGALLSLPLPKDLLPGETCTVLLDYVLHLPRTTDRFGLTDTGYQLGNAFPVLSVYRNGSWDERPHPSVGDPFFSEAADYKVAFSRPDNYPAIAMSGSILKEESGSDGTIITYAAASQARSFSILTAKKLQTVTLPSENGGPKITGLAFTREKAERAAGYAKKAIDIYSALFGPYPYDTFTVTLAEIDAGGMEYPGMAMIDRSLFVDGRARNLETTIAHEVAHQWFYGIVGNDEIGAPWLDEAICTYLTVVYFERAYEDPEIAERVLLSTIDDMAGGQWPIDGAASSYPDENAYSLAVYTRGGAMFRALRETIGDEAFFGALKDYVSRHWFALGSEEALISAFNSAAEQDLNSYFRGWLAPLE